MTRSSEILFVSKPVVPPWNDSSKNLVHDLARSMTRYIPRVMTTRDATLPDAPRAKLEPIYGGGRGRFAPSLAANARVLGRLVGGRRTDLWHFFFAPNRRSSRASAAAARLRRVPTVHTVCSAPPRDQRVAELLFADRTVVLSRHTEARLLADGVPRERVVRIEPAIEPLPASSEVEREQARRSFGLPLGAPLVVFPGDLEVGGGAERTLDAITALGRSVHLAVACRMKTPRARELESALRARAAQLGVARRVTFVGETPRIHALLATADVVALPSDDLLAKMDYPLVLLEAMSAGRPVIVARDTPAEELTEGGAAVAVPADPVAVAEAIGAILDDTGHAQALGEHARRAVETRFAPRRMADRYESLYDELLR